MRRTALVVVAVACSASPKPAPSPVAVTQAPEPAPVAPGSPRDAGPEAAIDAAPDTAPATTFHVGDVIGVRSHDDVYETGHAIAGTACLAVMPPEPQDAAFVADFSVGTVVAVSTTCPGDPETLAIQVGANVVATRAASVRRLATACLPAVATMMNILLPAWDRCRAKSRWKNDLAAVNVRFTAKGAVEDVAYQGGTAWGPKVARCIINAAKRGNLDGIACAGETVHLETQYW